MTEKQDPPVMDILAIQEIIPHRYPFVERYMSRVGGWINPGESAIVDPDGKFVVEPVSGQETILYGEVDPALLAGPRSQLDVAGHYGRPDVFDLRINRSEHPMVRVASIEETEPVTE